MIYIFNKISSQMTYRQILKQKSYPGVGSRQTDLKLQSTYLLGQSIKLNCSELVSIGNLTQYSCKLNMHQMIRFQFLIIAYRLCIILVRYIQYIIISLGLISMYQKTSEEEFCKAIIELGLKVRNDFADKQQLKFILMEILGYPSLQRALEHHNSSRLGTNDLLIKQVQIQQKVKQKDITYFQICNCCGLLLQNDELPYSTSLNQINLGIGVILFFKDLLYYAFIFLLMFLIYSIFAIATNSACFQEYSTTRDKICTQNFGCGFSDIAAGSKVLDQKQKKNWLSQIQSFIGVAFVIVWGILNMIKTHFQQKEIKQIEGKRVSASDFTLMIQNFPKIHLGQTQQQGLKLVQDIFNKYYESQKQKKQPCNYSYEVVSINIARYLYMQNRRNVQHKQKVMNELHERQDIFRQWIRYRKNNQKFLFDYSARERKYDEYNNYFTDIFEKQIFPKVPLQQKNLIFVTLRHSKAREQIQEKNAPVSILKFWKYFKQSDFPVQQVKISKAPEPEQIKWENIGFPSGQRSMRRLLAWMATIILIGVSLAISIGFSSIEEKSMGVSISISIVVTLVNLGIQVAIIYFSSLEYQYISSWQQSSMAIKIAVGQLVNSICVPIIVAAIFKYRTQKTYLRANGLADDIFFIALLNILVPISSLIDFYQIILKLIRWWKSDPDRRLDMYGQKQLNKYYGNYRFDIGYQYAFLIKTCIFTSFFVCMQPIIALFAPFSLIFYYLATKRNLLYHFQRPGYHYATTNNTVDVILLFSLFFFGMGCLFVNNLNDQLEGAQNNTKPINIAIVIIACAFLVIVPFRIFYCCIPQPEHQNKDYWQKKMLIYTDYDRTNPITKDSAITQFEHYIKNLEEEKGLPDQAQLVKLKSTIQHRQTFMPQNILNNPTNLRNSLARMSRVTHAFRPSVSLPAEPQFNYDLHFYEQIVQQKSIHFGKPDSPQKKMKQQAPTHQNLFKITQHSKPSEQNSFSMMRQKKPYE